MILKLRDIPIVMLKTEALSRRLAEHHFKKKEVEKHAKNLRAGYNGEKALDFTLGFLPEAPYIILHNLRIHDGSGFFQIDTLILSPQFILITEVKNISGTVTYDEFGQAIRILVFQLFHLRSSSHTVTPVLSSKMSPITKLFQILSFTKKNFSQK